MWIVHFPNGTIYRAGLAGSEQEAKEHGWVVEQNAQMHGVGHGYKGEEDFMARIVVREEEDAQRQRSPI